MHLTSSIFRCEHLTNDSFVPSITGIMTDWIITENGYSDVLMMQKVNKQIV